LRVICCFMSIFDVAMFSDVFYEINEKYYGNFNATLSTQLIEAFSSLQPKHYIALHIKCPCLWTNHRLASFIEKKCSIPDMNSHEIHAVGAERLHYSMQSDLIFKPIATKFKLSEGHRPRVPDMNSHENLCSWSRDTAERLYFHITYQ